ncbi:hypothetical protein [Paenibacillus polymyxa]|uniref:hypothetical protein n=1 Tax=Paenibacillus polymyxa TaxID=1406 RepID=UPI0025B6479A|nr:hypothetical protein [Paenibacillus polymyxa]
MCYIKIERKKTPLSLKGRVRSARGSTLVRLAAVRTFMFIGTCSCTTCVALHWYPLTGINRWALTDVTASLNSYTFNVTATKG